MSLKLEHVNKSFTGKLIIPDLSLEIEQGIIFGFLGPNGAGKTTTIRMILDIIRPNSGSITWNGQNAREVPRHRWGYLPEERGLYPKMTVEQQLLFLAGLYGRPRDEIKKDLDEWLERFQITTYRKKLVSELSKGNQQKVQFLATILHDPLILIMDEPFSGLDPVNAMVLKDAFLEMHRRGKTIIFSTHQMHQAEELCQQIAIISKGQILASGNIQQVRSRSGRKLVRLALSNDRELLWLETLQGVIVTQRRQDYVEMRLPPYISPNDILQMALKRGGEVLRFEQADPSLTDVFVELVAASAMPDAPMLTTTAGKEAF